MTITVQNLTKTFNRRLVLDDISFTISNGSTACIIGPNGAGKSTLLNCLTGLVPFDSGSIVIDHGAPAPYQIVAGNGRPVSGFFRQIGMLTQSSVLWSHFTVLQNISRPLMDIHGRGTHAKKHAEELLTALAVPKEIWNLLPNGYTAGGIPTLSGGERRKVALARALAHNPRILFLDELENNLDASSNETIRKYLIENYIQNPERTVVLVTHNRELVHSVASHVYELRDGKIAQKDLDDSLPSTTICDACLNAAVSISQNVVRLKETGISTSEIAYQLCTDFVDLLGQLEPQCGHLVTLVDRPSSGERPRIRMAAHSPRLILDGEDRGLLGLFGAEERPGDAGGGFLSINRAMATREQANTGQPIEVSKKGLISQIFENRQFAPWFRFSPSHRPVEGVIRVQIGHDGKPLAESVPYFQFSKETRQVYLFEILDESGLVGIWSIDTASNKIWDQAFIKHLKALANVASMVLRSWK